jgi:hypothetical protein
VTTITSQAIGVTKTVEGCILAPSMLMAQVKKLRSLLN